MSIVELATLKQYINVGTSNTVADDALQIILDGAQDYAARRTGLYLREDDDDGSKVEDIDGGAYLWPSYLPILSVTSVTDNEADDYSYEFKCTNINVSRDLPKYIWGDGIQRWRVTYTAGYTAATAPYALKQAILELAYRSWHGRGGKSQQSAKGFGYSFDGLANGTIASMLAQVSLRRLVL